jgi:hypothetical protein
MADVPSNIQEFNQIAGLIFAQLYKVFPRGEDIDRKGIAEAMSAPALEDESWEDHKLPSGQSFNQMLAHTIGWLNDQEYIKALGGHPAERVILTDRGLKALNAVPTSLGQAIGSALTGEAEKGPACDLSKIGDLVGGILGGYTVVREELGRH